MRAITLWQPWATLIAIGAKHFETRSWAPTWRGELAIHSASRNLDLDFCEYLPVKRILAKAGYTSPDVLPLGRIVAVTHLASIHNTADIRQQIPTLEALVGDFSDGRYAWRLIDTRRMIPVPARGSQGIWNWKEEPQPAGAQLKLPFEPSEQLAEVA